jgi:Ca-activated chloride channel family protein
MKWSIGRVALVVSLAAGAQAQQPEFKAGVELVSVPVSVTTRDRDTYIDGLTVADFDVSENGERQVVQTLTRSRRPVSICFVVDASGSMERGMRTEIARQAGRRIAGQLLPDDEMAIVLFAGAVQERLPWTRIADVTDRAWDRWATQGGTSLNDGMRVGLELIDQARNPRRAIVLLTDGFENASRESASSIVKTRRQSETTVYGIGIVQNSVAEQQGDRVYQGLAMPGATPDGVPPGPPTPGASDLMAMTRALPQFDYLQAMVGDSGGIVARAESVTEALDAAMRVINDLQREYLLGYSPTRPLDGKYRRLKVEVKRRGAVVRHRGGYLALPSAQAPSPKPQVP